MPWRRRWKIEKQFQFLVGTLKTWVSLTDGLTFQVVSIPRRYAKNPVLERALQQQSQVSIPRRYAKNNKALPGCMGAFLVSIPRRYAKNLENERGYLEWLAFQFLVGTLKTRPKFQCLEVVNGVSIPRRYAKNALDHIGVKNIRDKFQFLVGTLKTFQCWKIPANIRKFQFLVGTLKTRGWVSDRLDEEKVSIPRRYAKNLGTFQKIDDKEDVSIPRRYAKNEKPTPPAWLRYLSFNSS